MFNDEAVLALSNVLGTMVDENSFSIEFTAVVTLALLSSDRKRPVFSSILVSFVTRRLLLLPLSVVPLSLFVVVIATRIQALYPKSNIVNVVVYTVSDSVASSIISLTTAFDSAVLLLLLISFVVYGMFLPSRDDTYGLTVFRVAKFILVQNGVSFLLNTGAQIVVNPLSWVSAGVLYLTVSLTFEGVSQRQIDLLDAVLHASAATLSSTSLVVRSTIPNAGLSVMAVGLYVVSSALPRNKYIDIVRSVTLLIVILQLRLVSILVTTVVLLAEKSDFVS